MPDHKKLKPGDRILITSVPAQDLADERIRPGSPNDDMDTVGFLRRLIRSGTPVTIAWVDEYGNAWFDMDMDADGGQHSIAVMDDLSWVFAPK